VEHFVERANDLVTQAEQLVDPSSGSAEGRLFVNVASFHGVRAAGLSFLQSIFGTVHPYYTEFHQFSGASIEHAKVCGAILRAARDEMAGGWTTRVRGLIAAEVFSDFLEMARHLLDETYKDAAAVMVGSVLEEHLRQLCMRYGVAPEFTNQKGDTKHKKADALNAELTKAGVYSKLDQKNVTAWLDLRNEAAHGHYERYSQPQVELMQQAVSDFIARNPAT
jgi:hypothetical protein